ncbi:MAG: PH domain-containing protein [Acidobacteria bacterium]|nr:PH domain-containing protein [Acidobacteriota bacterium]
MPLGTQWTGSPSWWNYFGRVLGTVAFGAAAIAALFSRFEEKGIASVSLALVALAFFLSACWGKFSNRFSVSGGTVSATYGLLSQETHEIDVQDIRDLVLKQSLAGRILDYGTLEISSSGRDEAEVVFAGVPDPKSVKQLIAGLKRGAQPGQGSIPGQG